MRKILSGILAVLFLFGCSDESKYLNNIIGLRELLNNSSKCSYVASVTLDYGDSLYVFSANCTLDAENNMDFTIIEPVSIEGISGQLSGETGKLLFDEAVLAFPMLAGGDMMPITAPWLLVRTLKSGYINACGSNSTGYFARIDDSYNGVELFTEVSFDESNNPISADIVWDGKRIVSITIRDFSIM